MDFLLVSNRKNILRYNLLNPSEGLLPLPIEGIETAIALDFHMKNNCLYWSDASSKKILVCYMMLYIFLFTSIFLLTKDLRIY